jgi:antitoxin component YwqK of YwqJK toxin-antitoxin module
MKKILLTILPLLLIVGCSKDPEGVYNEEGGKDGKWTTWYEPENWYSSDSEKKSEGVYDNGEKVGEWTYWYENGNKKEEGETVKKQKVGEWTYWYEMGIKKK